MWADALEGFPRPMNHNRPAARDRAITASLILILVFIPYTLYQYDRFILNGQSPILNRNYAWHSLIPNLLIPVVTLAWLLPNLAWRRKNREEVHPWYYPSALVLVTFLFAITFYHLRLVGTFDTILVFYNLGLFLIISWILRWRDALIFFGVSNAFLVALALAEYTGLVRYAPLSSQGEVLASIYLDTDALAMSLVVYAVMAAIIVGTVTHFKRSLERMNSNLAASNQALSAEIGLHRETQQQKERLIADLERALNDVKTLKGLLPICAHCKKIRDDEGYWKRLEAYLHEHSQAKFTHTICPECLSRYYDKYAGNKEPGKPE